MPPWTPSDAGVRGRRMPVVLTLPLVLIASLRTAPVGWRNRWRAVVVEGASMLPTLHSGDCLLVVRTSRLHPGDIVVARHPREPGRLVVKRLAWETETGWWLVSDNPQAPGAADSFHFGAVPSADIVGRVVLRYFPLTRLAWWLRRRPVCYERERREA